VLGNKLGNYVDGVDNLLTMFTEILITDDTISDAGKTFQLPIVLQLGSALSLGGNQSFTIARNGSELPVINVNATILNDTSVTYPSK
jgi:hypothetical protein